MSPFDPAGIRILVVDDDPAILSGTVRLLAHAGYAVDQAPTGEAALQQVADHPPDLVLLDWILPGLDGLEVCRRLKGDPARSDILVVMVSAARTGSDHQAEGLESGADGYIARPIANRELLARVEALVRILTLTRLLRQQTKEAERITVLSVQAQDAALNLMEDAVEAHARLSESSRRLQVVMQHTPITLFSINPHGVFTLVEGRTGPVGPGFVSGGVIGRSVFEIYRDQPEMLAHLRRALTGESFTVEQLFAGGVTFEMTFTAMTDGPAGFAGTSGMLLDITERKHAERELRKLSNIIEQAPLAVIVTDLAGAIEYANPKFSEVTGYALSEVRGRNPRILQSGETRPEVFRELWQTLTAGEVWTGEVVNRRKNGENYLVTAMVAPVLDAHGRATHYVGLQDDITARRRHEAETTAMLEQERQVSEMKSRFISVTSHEFRTPMAAAMGSADLLANHFEHLAPTKRQELLARIIASLGRLAVMLDEVLLLSRMDERRLAVRLAVVDLRAYVLSVMEEIRLGDRDGHEFELLTQDGSLPFVTDTNLLHHILTNLLSNAARYSPTGSRILVRLETGVAGLRILVEDQGIGIPIEDIGRIFLPFERGSNVGQIKGTGLGLNIVKRMTEMLGGTLTVESVAGVGSQFAVSLPQMPLSATAS